MTCSDIKFKNNNKFNSFITIIATDYWQGQLLRSHRSIVSKAPHIKSSDLVHFKITQTILKANILVIALYKKWIKKNPFISVSIQKHTYMQFQFIIVTSISDLQLIDLQIRAHTDASPEFKQFTHLSIIWLRRRKANQHSIVELLHWNLSSIS